MSTRPSQLRTFRKTNEENALSQALVCSARSAAPAPTFSLAGAGSVLIGFTAACIAIGTLIGWAAGSLGYGLAFGAVVGSLSASPQP